MADIFSKYPNGGVVLNRLLADTLDRCDQVGTPIETWGLDEWRELESAINQFFKSVIDPGYVYGELTEKMKAAPGGITPEDAANRRALVQHMKAVKQQAMNAFAALRKRITNAQPHVREGMFAIIRDWRKVWRDPNIPEEKKTLAMAALSDREVLRHAPSDELTMQMHQAIQSGGKAFRTSAGFDFPVAQGVARENTERAEKWALQLMPADVAKAREGGGGVFAYAPDAEPRLREAMEQYADRLGDRDSDILFFAMSRFAERAKHPDDKVSIKLDELMAALGYAKHGGSSGGMSYQERDKATVRRQVEDLQNQHLTVQRIVKEQGSKRWQDIESRVFIIWDKVGAQSELDGAMRDWTAITVSFGRAWSYRLFSDSGRLVMNLHRQALAYHPTKETYEKRLAKALSFYWRVNIDKRTVAEYLILDIVTKYLTEPPDQIDRRKAERVEQALDQLQADGIIGGWCYADGTPLRKTEGALPHRWRESWLERTVHIEAPRELAELYHEQRKAKQLSRPPAEVEVLPQEGLGDRVRRFRMNRGITAMQAAKQIGIDNGTLSKIENGKLQAGPRVARKIEAWMRDLENRPGAMREMHQ